MWETFIFDCGMAYIKKISIIRLNNLVSLIIGELINNIICIGEN